MVEQNQQPKEGEEKFSIFKISEWPSFVRNWFWRLPGIKRARVGRKTIGERSPPIWYELNKIWFPKNEIWFKTKLRTIEDFWNEQGKHLGSGKDSHGENSLIGNPKGIVKMYEELGAYFDIERVNSEVGFFEVGTGFTEENVDYGLPKDPNLWEQHQWGKMPETKKRLEEALANHVGVPLQKRIKLMGSTVYHENKEEFKEELYCFGYTIAEALSKRLALYNEQFNLQAFQRYKIQVTLRTRTGAASKALVELIGRIAKIEEEIYHELEVLKGMTATYSTKWTDQVVELSPESKKIGIIRYPHTYRIVKQFHYLTHEEAITEEIAIRDRKVVEQDEEGRTGGIVNKHTLKRDVIIKLKQVMQEKNIYDEEEDELKENIKELKIKINNINEKITKGKIREEEKAEQLLIVKGYEKRIETYEERLNDIKHNIINKQHIIEETTPNISENEFWQRPEEVDYGLDENGYPLEIDSNTGEILIDGWWNEIAQNEWQLKTIASKPGGLEYLKKHLDGFGATITGPRENPTVTILNRGSRRIRHVKDKRFHGYVDLLELGTIIYSGWDSFRDDLRDGRYHKHSKSVGDYVIEGEGGFDDKLGAPFQKTWAQLPGGLGRRKGFYIKRRGIINVPIKRINIELDVQNRDNLIKAMPDWFNKNLPFDERNITQDYVMKLPDGTFMSGIRRPTKYNPAFDRRAQNLDYVHWGRMYYYRWSGDINEWDENPFPHISTRGIAQYIDYLVKSDVWDYRDAEKALEGHKFDYGVRGQGEYGEVNPASGEGVLQEN